MKRNSELLTVLNSLPQVQVCPSLFYTIVVVVNFYRLSNFKGWEFDFAGYEEDVEEWKEIVRREPSTRCGAKFENIVIADIDMDIADIHITTQKM